MEIDNSKDESRQGLVLDKPTPIQDLVRDRVRRAVYAKHPIFKQPRIASFGPNDERIEEGGRKLSYDEAKGIFHTALTDRLADAAISEIYEALQEAELPLQETFVFGKVVLLRHQFEKVFHGIFKSLAHLHEQHKGERR